MTTDPQPTDLDCTCRIVGIARDPYEPQLAGQPEWEQDDNCPVHPLSTKDWSDDWRTMPVTYARAIPSPAAADVHRVQVRAVLAEHRRHRNVRACTGCDWSPSPVGRTGDPEAMGRRAAQFNTHLAHLIVDTLAPQLLAVPALDSRHAHGPATVTSTTGPEAHTPPGQREAPH